MLRVPYNSIVEVARVRHLHHGEFPKQQCAEQVL